MKIEEKVVPEEQIAVINHVGAPEEMGRLIEEIIIWAEANEIKLAGPPFAIYYSNPKDSPEKMVYDIGFPVEGEITGDKRINIAVIPEHKVVYTLYQGPYTGIPDAYQAMVEFVMMNSYDVIGSPKEIYHNSPDEVAAGELMTEIHFPVIKIG